MIDRGKSKTLSEVKPVENISKNQQSFLEISPVQQEVQKESLIQDKDSHSIKFERRPLVFAKLSLREVCDSKLSGLHSFDNIAIIHSV